MAEAICDVCSVTMPFEESSTCEECGLTLCMNCSDSTMGRLLCDECATKAEDAAKAKGA